mgnify:FL=1
MWAAAYERDPENRRRKPRVIILAPTSCIRNWENEFKKWCILRRTVGGFQFKDDKLYRVSACLW